MSCKLCIWWGLMYNLTFFLFILYLAALMVDTIPLLSFQIYVNPWTHRGHLRRFRRTCEQTQFPQTCPLHEHHQISASKNPPRSTFWLVITLDLGNYRTNPMRSSLPLFLQIRWYLVQSQRAESSIINRQVLFGFWPPTTSLSGPGSPGSHGDVDVGVIKGVIAKVDTLSK